MSSADRSPDSAKWISPGGRIADARIRLFCLPHAGAGTAAFHIWKRTLPSFVELCPILLPGREVRLAESSYSTCDALIQELTGALTGWLDKPYAIFGHSMGALLAFELAQDLRAKGLRQPDYLFLSGRIAAHLSLRGEPIHALPSERFIAELETRYGGLPQELLQDADMLELFLPILRADLTLIETHMHRERPPLDCPVMIAAGTDDWSVSSEALAAWSRHTTGKFELHRFAGGHFYLSGASRALLLEHLCARLTTMNASASATLQSV